MGCTLSQEQWRESTKKAAVVHSGTPGAYDMHVESSGNAHALERNCAAGSHLTFNTT